MYNNIIFIYTTLSVVLFTAVQMFRYHRDSSLTKKALVYITGIFQYAFTALMVMVMVAVSAAIWGFIIAKATQFVHGEIDFGYPLFYKSTFIIWIVLSAGTIIVYLSEIKQDRPYVFTKETKQDLTRALFFPTTNLPHETDKILPLWWWPEEKWEPCPYCKSTSPCNCEDSMRLWYG